LLHGKACSPGKTVAFFEKFAARSGQMRTLTYLLSLPGLDATLRDDRGQSAQDAARANDKTEALQALEAYLSSKQ
jgi:hypothetical protein